MPKHPGDYIFEIADVEYATNVSRARINRWRALGIIPGGENGLVTPTQVAGKWWYRENAVPWVYIAGQIKGFSTEEQLKEVVDLALTCGKHDIEATMSLLQKLLEASDTVEDMIRRLLRRKC